MDLNIMNHMYQHSPFGFAYHKVMYGPDGTPEDYIFLYVNPAFEALTGLHSEEILERPVTQVLPNIRSGAFDWVDFYGRIVSEGKKAVFEQYAQPLKRWFKVHAYPIDSAHFAATFLDVTEDRHREEELRRSRNELSEAHRMSKMGRWDLFHTNNQLRWSDTIFEIFEIDPDHFEASYEAFLNTIHPEDRDMVNQAWIQSLNTRAPYSIEHRVLLSGGRVKWLKERCSTEFDKEGNPIQSTGIVQDITEYKDFEREREAQTRLQQLLIKISSSFINAPLHQIQSLVNEALRDLGRFVEADHVKIFEYHFDENYCAITYEWCKTGITPHFEQLQQIPFGINPDWVHTHSQGKSIFIPDVSSLDPSEFKRFLLNLDMQSLLAVPMMSEEGCIGFVSFDWSAITHRSSDIEEQLLHLFAEMMVSVENRKEAQKNLEYVQKALYESKEQAQAASLAKSQFVSNMSHEIRTPLNGVIGFSKFLKNTTMTDEQQEYLGYIESSAKNLLALVNDILDLSKIEAGKMELHLEPESVEEICKTAMDSVRHLAYTKKLALSLKMDPCLAIMLIEVDGDRLRQVLLNLLGNAVKFTQEGEVLLSVVLEKDFRSDGTGEIRFTVRDTGPGIEEAHQIRLFEDFYQVDDSDTRKHGGTGLGLAISQRILHLMGSRLILDSKLGQGSAFSFLLKVASAPCIPSTTVPLDDANQENVANAQRQIKPYKILIAEDNPINQKLIRLLVKKLLPNASVSIAETGLEGFNQWKELKPDLMLMDLLMPEMDGIEATQAIRAQETHTHTPIIALTAAAESQDLERCIQAGMDGYLTKPVAVEALLVELEKWLEPSADTFSNDSGSL